MKIRVSLVQVLVWAPTKPRSESVGVFSFSRWKRFYYSEHVPREDHACRVRYRYDSYQVVRRRVLEALLEALALPQIAARLPAAWATFYRGKASHALLEGAGGVQLELRYSREDVGTWPYTSEDEEEIFQLLGHPSVGFQLRFTSSQLDAPTSADDDLTCEISSDNPELLSRLESALDPHFPLTPDPKAPLHRPTILARKERFHEGEWREA